MHSTLFLGGVTIQYSGRQSNPRASMPEMIEGSKEHTQIQEVQTQASQQVARVEAIPFSRSPSLSLSSKGCLAIQNARLATCDIVYMHTDDTESPSSPQPAFL